MAIRSEGGEKSYQGGEDKEPFVFPYMLKPTAILAASPADKEKEFLTLHPFRR